MYKFGASDPAHLPLRGNNLVMWHGIQECAQHDCSNLSMGKTAPAQHGLIRFKAGWGATAYPRQYRRWEDQNHTWTMPDNYTTGWQNRLCRHAPIPALQLAGELLYKHVG
jgi:hypothetical protein